MAIDDNKVAEKLTGFIFGFTMGVSYLIKNNAPLPTFCEVTPMGNFDLYTSVRCYSEEIYIVFQLGKQCVQVDQDSFFAKNVITVVLGQNPRILNTKIRGKEIQINLEKDFHQSVKDVVVLFNDDFDNIQ
ncbi:hypothetical protein [Aeromonas phage AerS_266]|nr:hypothetical protein [Aeromonas phage AerS_266]